MSNRPFPEPRLSAAGFGALLDRVAVRVGRARNISKNDVRAAIEAFAEELFTEIRLKRKAHWPKRGVFRVRRRKSRRICNPVTGSPMSLPPSMTITFRPSKFEKAQLSP